MMKTIIVFMVELSPEQKESLLRMAEICNEKHLKHCDCRRELVSKAFKSFELCDKDKVAEVGDDEYVIKSRRDAYLRRAYEVVADVCREKGFRCLYEVREIEEIVECFGNKYDLGDVRVLMIVKSVLAHKLSALRMQRYSSFHGVLQEVYDREGNLRLELNPVEGAKREFDKCVIDAVRVLDGIISGSKSVVEHKGKIDLGEFLQVVEDKSVDQL
jgi:hypothetical protein